MKLAFQGEHGAYSEMAAMKHFGRNIRTIPCKTFKDVFVAVEDDKAEIGIIPVENSKAGDVYEAYDLLLDFPLHVCGEVFLRIVHYLIGQKDATLRAIRKVYSHPQALAQCGAFLDSLNVEKIVVYDTAGAVAMIRNSGKKEEAAIASELAAGIYGMKVLKKRIETDKDNTTRFFLVAKERKPAGNAKKTAIVFGTQHRPGALFKCLEGFANNKVNLTKLVSRPLKGKKWKYLFYADFEGGVYNDKVKAALETLEKNSEFTRILGSYS